jgi:hypothetical protein
MKQNKLIKTTKKIREIEVVDGVVVKCEGTQLCYPEAHFEMVESCKLCGKCI